MVDLKRQYAGIKQAVDEAVAAVMDSTAFINGQTVVDFSDQLAAYLNVKHVIPCANGTDALQIALMAAGLQPGDEVITPSFYLYRYNRSNCTLETDTGICRSGSRYFLHGSIKPLKKPSHPKQRQLCRCISMDNLPTWKKFLEIAKAHHLHVIEDNAQAIGADYTFSDGTVKKTGTMGDIGCTSFFPSKNLGCFGDGGAVCTNDDSLAEKMRMIANHGQSKKYYS